MERPLPPLHRSLAFIVLAEHISRGQYSATKVLRRLSGDFLFIEPRRIVLCDLGTVCDETDFHLQALLLRILPDEPVQFFPCFFLILYDRDPEHPAPTFSLHLIAV